MDKKESDKMYTFTLPGEPAAGELIPAREKTGTPEKAPEKVMDNAVPAKHNVFNPPPQSMSRVENTILNLNRSPIKRNFYELAVRYADIPGQEAPQVSFMCYWPSYELMSEEQLQWYFFLRSKFRSYEYPPADLSYIFLYVYELINGIGIGDAADGLVRMIKIWNGYKTLHRKLNGYLPEWVVDYMDVYKCRSDEIFALLNDCELTPYISDNYIITRYIGTDELMPVEIIAKLSEYAFYKSKFIAKKETADEEPDNERMFFDGLPRMIKNVDNYMKSEGRGLFDTYKPTVIQATGRIPFRSAIFEKDLRTNPIASDYMGFKPLRSFIAQIIKHYENELRALCGQKGRLKTDPLPEATAKIIKSCAADAYERSRRKETVITVNKSALIRLMNEAEIIKKILLERDDEDLPATEFAEEIEEIEEIEEAIETQETGVNDIKEIGTEQAKETVTPLPENFEDCDSDIAHLLASLSGVQTDIIIFICEHDGRCDDKTLSDRFRNVFISTETDTINEKSLELLADLLIAYEDGEWYITEDYLNETVEYLKQPSEDK